MNLAVNYRPEILLHGRASLMPQVFGVDRRRWWLPTHSKQQTQLMLEQALSPAAAEEQHLQLPMGQLPV